MWFKRQMIILPSKNGNSKIGLNPNALFNKPYLYYFSGGAVYHECQHLYIISDEEIKKGDRMYSKMDGYPIQWDGDLSETKNPKEYGYNKIIATTDTSLTITNYNNGTWSYLPQPSQQFIQQYIEEYNKGNVITEVEVEYEEIINPIWESYFEFTDYCMKNGYNEQWYSKEKLKVNPDNTINIKPTKDSWSREEVIALHKANCERLTNAYISADIEWLEENL